MSDYDLNTLGAIIEENLWQAACDGLDDDAVADLLLRHRDGVMCDSLAGNVGFKRELVTDGDFSRRRFLGAAAALSTLAVGTSGTVVAEGDEKSDETGDAEDIFTSLELPEMYDFETSYSIRIYENDPNADVALSLGGDFGGIRMEMTADRAEELADDLREAAREGGSDD